MEIGEKRVEKLNKRAGCGRKRKEMGTLGRGPWGVGENNGESLREGGVGEKRLRIDS